LLTQQLPTPRFPLQEYPDLSRKRVAEEQTFTILSLGQYRLKQVNPQASQGFKTILWTWSALDGFDQQEIKCLRRSEAVELEGKWSQTEELLYCLFYVKSPQQARELEEEETSERLGRMGQSGASILPRKTAGPVPGFEKGNRPYGLFDRSKPGTLSQPNALRGRDPLTPYK
jgi:hypothetical protein